MTNPLRRFAPSPFSRLAARCGKVDAASAAGQPLRGGRWPGPRPVEVQRHGQIAGDSATPARAPRGFTLIELMVAIAVMALIAIMSWRGLDGMVRSQEQTRQRTDGLLVMETVLAQWKADLDALQAIEGTEPLTWDGQVLRMTRHGTRQPDDGALVVAWTVRAVGDSTQWLRWQSGPVRTRGDWEDAWQRAASWSRTPSEAERRAETVLMPLQQWQLFYHRGGAWSNAQSSNGNSAMPQTPGGLSPEAASIPDGVRLQLLLPQGGALAGPMTIDWVNPLQGGNKS